MTGQLKTRFPQRSSRFPLPPPGQAGRRQRKSRKGASSLVSSRSVTIPPTRGRWGCSQHQSKDRRSRPRRRWHAAGDGATVLLEDFVPSPHYHLPQRLWEGEIARYRHALIAAPPVHPFHTGVVVGIAKESLLPSIAARATGCGRPGTTTHYPRHAKNLPSWKWWPAVSMENAEAESGGSLA